MTLAGTKLKCTTCIAAYKGLAWPVNWEKQNCQERIYKSTYLYGDNRLIVASTRQPQLTTFVFNTLGLKTAKCTASKKCL